MKTFLILLATCLCASAQNFAVLQAKDDPDFRSGVIAGIPANWPTRVQPIGAAVSLPAPYAPPWKWVTGKQLDDLKAANEVSKEAWNKAQEDAPRIAAEQAKAAEAAAKAAKKVEADAAITEVEIGFKEWQSADEKAKGDVLLKLLHLILDALRSLGSDVRQVDKLTAEIAAPK